jgi:hypothetical protein
LLECEDAIAGDPASGRFAIADGASESYASGEWAKLLVDGFVRAGTNRDWLQVPQQRWQDDIGRRASSWYAEEKFTAGAHATFLGVQFTHTDGEANWGAEAVGDSCMFILHDDHLETSFPMSNSSEFTRAPSLLNSHGGSPVWEFGMGALPRGSVLVLASDALAQYLLRSSEQKAFIGQALLHVDDRTFPEWVEASRATGDLRNDDVALGLIEWV